MAVVWGTEGRSFTLARLMDDTSWMTFLWSDDIEPDITTTYDDLTEVASSNLGYQAISWNSADVDENGNAVITGDLNEHIHNGTGGSQTVYGWGVRATDGVAQVLILIERFNDAPRILETAGDAIRITPRLNIGEIPV